MSDYKKKQFLLSGLSYITYVNEKMKEQLKLDWLMSDNGSTNQFYPTIGSIREK